VDQVEFISGEESAVGAVLNPREEFEGSAEVGDPMKDGREVGLGYYPEGVETAKMGEEDGEGRRDGLVGSFG
jgi:hypothetical protein